MHLSSTASAATSCAVAEAWQHTVSTGGPAEQLLVAVPADHDEASEQRAPVEGASPAGPISPELVLVDPELAVLARAGLPGPELRRRQHSVATVPTVPLAAGTGDRADLPVALDQALLPASVVRGALVLFVAAAALIPLALESLRSAPVRFASEHETRPLDRWNRASQVRPPRKHARAVGTARRLPLVPVPDPRTPAAGAAPAGVAAVPGAAPRESASAPRAE